jgi:hypothetical protein
MKGSFDRNFPPIYAGEHKPLEHFVLQDPSSRTLLAFALHEPIPIVVTVRPRIVRMETIISMATGFFGSLLTLPGILSFIEQRRKARRERQAEAEKRRSPIITDLSP